MIVVGIVVGLYLWILVVCYFEVNEVEEFDSGFDLLLLEFIVFFFVEFCSFFIENSVEIVWEVVVEWYKMYGS